MSQVDAAKMNTKSDRLSHRKKDDKKSYEGRRYAQISVDSVTAAADSVGMNNVSEEASKRLADDVSYRLREVVHKCAVNLRHSCRSKLTANDLNYVFQLSDAPRCYGSTDNLKYIYIKEARVFVAEDEEVDLISAALRSEVYIQKDECFIKGTWVFPDKVFNDEAGKTEETTSKTQEGNEIHPKLLEYYKIVGKSLLGKSKKLFEMAVCDLRSNPKISPVAPFIVNLIAAYIHHHKSNGIKIYTLLLAVDALIQNKSIDMRASDSCNTLVTSLLLFVINPLAIHGKSTLDDIYLRKFASEMIVKVLKHWHPLEVVLYVELYYNLAGTLMNPQNTLLSHLGALYSMISFGSEALDKCLWPNLTEYLAILDEAEKSKNYTGDVKGAILDAAEQLFLKNVNSVSAREMVVYKCDLELQTQLYEYFGDTICARRRWCGTPGNILESPEDTESDALREMNININKTKSAYSLKTYRPLPVIARTKRYSVDIFRSSVEEEFNQFHHEGNKSDCPEELNIIWVPRSLPPCRLRYPQLLFELHTSYSKIRCIGKTRRKLIPNYFKNISGNILVSL